MAQNALLRAWRHKDKLDDPNRIHEWISRIARNEALRELDRRLPIPVEELDLEPEEDEALAGVVESVAVMSLLNRLSEEERNLVGLRYEEDMTQSAIAEHLGIPEGTVKVRLHRVRQKLRRGPETR